jgi:hypothetical protein
MDKWQTETTSMGTWLGPAWSIRPHNAVTPLVAPPAPAIWLLDSGGTPWGPVGKFELFPHSGDERRGPALHAIDPVIWALCTAPVDDEPLTPEDRSVLDRRRASVAAGNTVSDDEVDGKLAQ